MSGSMEGRTTNERPIFLNGQWHGMDFLIFLFWIFLGRLNFFHLVFCVRKVGIVYFYCEAAKK
jgi:hypothetical protein